jgi:hypothetical protein
MKPYLTLYIFSQYSLNLHKKAHAQRILHRKLHKFVNYNSNFGRRKVQLVSNNPFSTVRQCKYFFEEKYLPFYDKDENFMESHTDLSFRQPSILLRLAPIANREQQRVSTPVLPDSDSDREEHENDEGQEETNDDRYHNRVVIDESDTESGSDEDRHE